MDIRVNQIGHLVRQARAEAPGRSKLLLHDAFRMFEERGVVLHAKHTYLHHTHSTRLSICAGYIYPFDGMLHRISADAHIPHYDRALTIAMGLLTRMADNDLPPGSYNFGNMIMITAREVRKWNSGWNESVIERVMETSFSRLVVDPQVFCPNPDSPTEDCLTTEEQDSVLRERIALRRQMLEGTHQPALALVKKYINSDERPTFEEQRVMLNFVCSLNTLDVEILQLFMKHPNRFVRELLRKAWMNTVVCRCNLVDDYGLFSPLLPDEANDEMREATRHVADDSDDVFQPHDVFDVRKKLIDYVFARDLRPVYFEAYWLSKLLCQPGFESEDQRELTCEWSGGGLIEDGSHIPGYFRLSVHNGPNKNDMELLAAIVAWWVDNDKSPLETLDGMGLLPAELYIETPEEVSESDKVFAQRLLKVLREKYSFSDQLNEKIFWFYEPDQNPIRTGYQAASLEEKLQMLLHARERLKELLANPPGSLHQSGYKSYGPSVGGINELFISEHTIYEAVLFLSSLYLGDRLATVDENNFSEALDFMADTARHLQYCGFAVEPLMAAIEDYRTSFQHSPSIPQVLYAKQRQVSRAFADLIASYSDSFDEIRRLMLANGEWLKGGREETTGYNHFLDNLLRADLVNYFSIIAERMERHLQAKIAAAGIAAGRLCLAELDEIALLNQPQAAPSEDQIFFIGPGPSALPVDRLRGTRLLGNKGYGLALAQRLGLPVPPAIALTTNLVQGDFVPESHLAEIMGGMDWLGQVSRKRFGDPAGPLLVSVRPSAPMVIPGAMSTILNVGVNREIAESLAREFNRGFAYSTYANFLFSYGLAVLGLTEAGVADLRVQVRAMIQSGQVHDREIFDDLLAKIEDRTKHTVPMQPVAQLLGSIEGVLRSYDNNAASGYRRMYGIPEDWRMAILLQRMVFGNRRTFGARSGAFSLSSHHPASGVRGRDGFYGDAAWEAQGDEIMSGFGQVVKAHQYHPDLTRLVDDTSRITPLPRQVEATLDEGRVYLLQVKEDALSPEAMLHALVGLVQTQELTKLEAVRRARAVWDELSSPRIDQSENPLVVAQGIGAAAGVASGGIALPTTLEELRSLPPGSIVVADYLAMDLGEHDLQAVAGVLTIKGGMGSHAANLARKIGLPCIAGCQALAINIQDQAISLGGKIFKVGEQISLNGSTGEIYPGPIKVAPPPLIRYLQTRTVPDLFEDPDTFGFYQDYQTMLLWARELDIYLPKLG